MTAIHVLAVVAVLLGAVALRATEVYASRYQSLPVLDWVESRPPLTDSTEIPAAVDLARGASRALPLLLARDEPQPQMPVFGPPSNVQRILGGVRDAARITLAAPTAATTDQAPVSARLDVVVFNRTLRAAAWNELMRSAMDIRDPDSGAAQVRTAGPDERDSVWLTAPGPGSGSVATVVGQRGPVGWVLQVTFSHAPNVDVATLVDLDGRAEVLARQAARDWSGWLESQVAA